MKEKVKNLLYALLYLNYKRGYTKTHKREIKNFCRAANIVLSPKENEKDFINKWAKIYDNVNVDFFRFYSTFIGEDINIVPDDIFHIIIEPILNNQVALSVYSDKNMYEKLLPADYFPECVLRNMEYDYMDRDYKYIEMTDGKFEEMVLRNKELIEEGQLIIKPTTDTGAGHGVRLFLYNKGKWVSNDGMPLDLHLLNSVYKCNFIIQKCIKPSSFVKQFNPTSFNTFRVITYRSIKDNKPHFLGGYMRVGAKGNFKDNVWGGGYACAMNENGRLSDFASDSSRKHYDNINGISLVENHFDIPNWDKILDLVYKVAATLTPNRLINFDIMLDEYNTPHIIEFNIKGQTVTTQQTMKCAYFGDFTDEVIEYCKNHLDKICYELTFRKS